LGWNSHQTRLRTMARQLGRCAIHPTIRLQCGACDWEWTGTDDEADALVRLVAPLSPYMARIPPQGRCACGQPTHCSSCWTAAAGRIVIPDDLTTDDDMTRYFALAALFRRKEPYALPGTPRTS